MKKQTGLAAFDEYYSQYFTTEKWEQIKTAFMAQQLPCLLINKKHFQSVKTLWNDQGISWKPLAWFPMAVEWPVEKSLGETLPGFVESWIYPLNPSSLVPVLACQLGTGQRVLDACAAPGGKTLALLTTTDDTTLIVANDLSTARRTRMKDLFNKAGVSYQVEVLGRPAETLFKTYHNAFDIILCDAPCSSEEHIFNNQTELSKWYQGRVRRLSKRQLSLLLGLWYSLKPGGRLVYSTCAITPEENEGVVGSFLKKRKDASLLSWKLETPGQAGLPGTYKSEFNLADVRRIFPTDKLTPMFVAALNKAL